MSGVQAVRGMNDVLPAQAPLWQTLDAAATSVFSAYGYRQIRLPLVERTELFKRAVGEVTDIVEKEMYSFDDRSGENISLRPEGTAGCVRAAIENGLLHNQVQKLWYNGPMFRHERPQKGRYRQFNQYGVEAFGLPGPDVDAEQIAICARLWEHLGIRGLRLQINSLGTAVERASYRDKLVTYFSAHEQALDADSQRRLKTNPLRILDSKNPGMAELIAAAPSLLEQLGDASRAHFDGLQQRLQALGIAYEVNPRLVRGLDYYTRTVFEWLTDQLGAQDAVCSGGRFDGLVDLLGGKATPAVGFALGVERLVALMDEQGVSLCDDAPHIYVVHQGEKAAQAVLGLSEQLRDELPGLRVAMHLGGGSFKSQFKRADKSGARVALIMGEAEVAAGKIQMKPLRTHDEQQDVTLGQVAQYLRALLDL